MIGTVGWQQLLLILVILALLFGARRVSDLGGALGRGIKEFRSEVRDSSTDDEEPPKEESTSVASVAPSDERAEPTRVAPVAPSAERTEPVAGTGAGAAPEERAEPVAGAVEREKPRT